MVRTYLSTVASILAMASLMAGTFTVAAFGRGSTTLNY